MAVDIHEAKTNLSRLIERVLAGEEIVITRSGKPVAKLVPIEKRSVRRTPGRGRGRVRVSDDFDAPLPEEIQSYFE